MDPNSAEDRTDTLAAPPRRRPATAAATFMKPCPASPAFRTDPNMTKMATMETETPVKLPQIPPSAIVSVPRKLFNGVPGWPNSPGIYCPKSPYSRVVEATKGSGQPIARRAISSTVTNRMTAIPTWNVPSRNPYWSDRGAWFQAIHKQAARPRLPRTAPEIRSILLRAIKIIAQGRARAICKGRDRRLGTSPEKISHK